MSKKQKIYTAEFKAEAIKATGENKGNVSETARQLGISMQYLVKLVQESKDWDISRNTTIFARSCCSTRRK